jgi:hypothetical protein
MRFMSKLGWFVVDETRLGKLRYFFTLVKVNRRINPSPPNGLEPALHTSVALVDHYPHELAYLKQLTMKTVHFLQLDCAGTEVLPRGYF